MLDTDKAWRKWGRDDPYFGVLADARFTTERIGESREAFFATGRKFVAWMLGEVEKSGALKRGRALDHGCGVGRLSLPLAACFDVVVAIDVAPAMLGEAAANAARAEIANVHFALADDRLSCADGQFDLVNSHLVLQHIPVRRGLAVLDRLVDRLAPGGALHVSLSMRTDRGPPRWLYWASANIPGVKAWQNVCAGRGWNAPAMQMNHYPVDAVIARLATRSIAAHVVATNVEPRFTTYSLIGRANA